jgi:hypothetical protein
MKLLVLGLAAYASIRHLRRRPKARVVRVAGTGRATRIASDPGDPVQGFDEVIELQVTPLDVDALSNEDVEAAQDLAGLESEIEEIAREDDAATELVEVELVAASRDAGDLYGAHTPVAVDRDLPDDDHANNEGQNWIEALETSAIENGAEPERELDAIIDDEDMLRPPHASHTRDTPVADLGSGGRRGL